MDVTALAVEANALNSRRQKRAAINVVALVATPFVKQVDVRVGILVFIRGSWECRLANADWRMLGKETEGWEMPNAEWRLPNDKREERREVVFIVRPRQGGVRTES